MNDTVDNDTTAPAQPANPDLRWYVVHAYSGMEKAVERNITERINRAGMQGKFGRILVPSEEVVDVKKKVRKGHTKKFHNKQTKKFKKQKIKKMTSVIK